jgi:hypothetical protein
VGPPWWVGSVRQEGVDKLNRGDGKGKECDRALEDPWGPCLVQVLAENIYHQQYHHHKVGNNSSYNFGLIMPSSLMTIGSDKYSWSHVDLRIDPIHSRM